MDFDCLVNISMIRASSILVLFYYYPFHLYDSIGCRPVSQLC